MKPSTFASFVVFLVIGFNTIWTLDLKLEDETSLLIKLTIFMPALYCYYLNLASETMSASDLNDAPFKSRLASWFITAIQYILFSSIWFTLGKDYLAYSLLHVSLNFTYLVWDGIYWDIVKKQTRTLVMFGFDCFSFILALILLSMAHDLPSIPANGTYSVEQLRQFMHITLVCEGIIILSVAGLIAAIILWRFNPFKLLAMDGSIIWPEENATTKGGE